jgi:hypothetical protein
MVELVVCHLVLAVAVAVAMLQVTQAMAVKELLL